MATAVCEGLELVSQLFEMLSFTPGPRFLLKICVLCIRRTGESRYPEIPLTIYSQNQSTGLPVVVFLSDVALREEESEDWIPAFAGTTCEIDQSYWYDMRV